MFKNVIHFQSCQIDALGMVAFDIGMPRQKQKIWLSKDDT